LVSSTSTATYALVNPNTWAAGVIINLIIESGAIVAGRGGDGGRGGYGYTVYSTTSGYVIVYYDDGQKGFDGGSAIHAQYPINIENNGGIFAGGGGGGGSGGVIISNAAGFHSVSGCGGGGGWPLGVGGRAGRIDNTDTATADYNIGSGYGAMFIGNAGYNASSAFGSGAAGRDILPSTGSDAHAGRGGNGGDYDTASVGGASSGGSAPYGIWVGNGGNGGNAGDYAINGNSFITWIATGTRYGAIV
jgi:hypothetical protein